MRNFKDMGVEDVVRLVRPYARQGKTQAETCDIIAKCTDIYFGNAGLTREGTPAMSKHAWAVYCIDKAINRMFSQEQLVYLEAMNDADMTSDVALKRKFLEIGAEASANVLMLKFAKKMGNALNEAKRQAALATHASINTVRSEEGIPTPKVDIEEEYLPMIPAHVPPVTTPTPEVTTATVKAVSKKTGKKAAK